MDWGLIAAIGGGAAAFAGGVVADIVRSHLNLGEARAEREAARAAFKEDQRIAFELETLLALQSAVQAMARRAVKSHQLDEVHYETTGEWGTQELPADIGGDESLAVGQEFIRLRSRVLDQDLRALLDAFHQTVTKHTLTARPDHASPSDQRARAVSLIHELAEQVEAVQDRTGERLRQLHS